MRLIGHLTEKTSALTFSDFLYVQGIGNEVESEKEGWAIWIHGEDEVPRARELLGFMIGWGWSPVLIREHRLSIPPPGGTRRHITLQDF